VRILPVLSQETLQMLMGYGPIVLMALVFYLLLYRPQRKQMKRREEMLNSLKKGDRVITTGGMFGTITALSPKTVMLKVADKVELEFSRSAVQGLQQEEKKA
jgi:preprotein translocase subunit YajC